MVFLVVASEPHQNGGNWVLQQLEGKNQIWAPQAVFCFTIVMDVFIFIFFLAGIDTSVQFFEENPNTIKHIVIYLYCLIPQTPIVLIQFFYHITYLDIDTFFVFYMKENICSIGVRIMSSLVIPSGFDSGKLLRTHHCPGMTNNLPNLANIAIVKSMNSENDPFY